MSYDDEQKYGTAHDNPDVEEWGTWVSAETKTDIIGYKWRRIGRTYNPVTWGTVFTILMTIPGCVFLYKLFYDAVHIR